MDVTEQATHAAADTFTCEGCGSQMRFDPDSQGLKCEHCGGEKAIPSELVEAPEYLYDPRTDSYTAPDWQAQGGRTVRCKNCGAQTVVSAAAMTSCCAFCGSTYVMDQDEIQVGILPETMMPFQFSREKATAQYKKWLKSRFWAPRKFKKSNHQARELQGMYLPFWTYDAELHTDYRGMGGMDRTETYTTTDGEGHTETHTRTVTDWYPISGEENLAFDDEAVCATRHVDLSMLRQLGQFTTKVLRRYSPAFLAGFTAQRYDVGVGEGWNEASGRMRDKMESHIRDERGYDHYRGMQYDHFFSPARFKHILLPVWLSSYTYKNKVYHFMVNGETGKVAGKAPVSVLKVLLAALLVLGIVALVFALMAYFD